MTDIRLPLGGLKFSVRVVILCTRGPFLLTNTGAGESGAGFHFLPGGAVGVDEATETAAQREWQEETGLPAGPLRLVGVMENFFGPAKKRQHELGFYYHMDAPDEVPAAPFLTLDNAEVSCQWVAFSNLETTPVYPLVVRELLEVPVGVVRHLVNRESPGT
ncbi:NUDIX domain-containing protein [Deinococcus sp. HMF7604]|uniref:NUDIX domain-containing protein n=1 Tax=Deinococcus betulae TaxID=2873312 RepID=UPI001CCD6589|nr:NUDIX domain-containing protein [Deinococcus betulae]MBZ9749412.1 NUDIX domain-containing protein [Deinococcus betulae]